MSDLSNVDWGSVADWVSGLGSMSAAVIALYLARSAERIKLDGYCGLRIVVGGGLPQEEILMIAATNIGSRGTVITNISMRVGKRQAIITAVKDRFSDGTPVRLEDGQDAKWGISVGQDSAWLRDLCSGIVTSPRDVNKLRIRLHTSHGAVLVIKPEQSVKTRLVELLAEKAAAISEKAR